jgi:Protein of unknown function (DUF3501)
MKKIALDDIRPPRLYERARDEARRRVIDLKKARRVALGPDVTLVFENRETLIYQIEEMARAEHLDDPRKIQDEIDVYNALVPDEGELSATLFVEIIEESAIRPTLGRLVGIDEKVVLEVGGVAVKGEFEAGRSEADRISSVQYLRFRLPEPARRLIATPGTEVALSSGLPGYAHRVVVGEATRASLAKDLA